MSRLKEAEKDMVQLQNKSKKEKLVSLGRGRLSKRVSEIAVNTSQSTFGNPQTSGNF